MKPTSTAWLALLGVALVAPWAWGNEYILREFEKIHLTPQYWSEGASIGDLNGDGQPDLVAGAHYYLGPKFSPQREYTVPLPGNKRNPFDWSLYTNDHFFSWVRDLNGDGRPDILVVPLPEAPIYWFENPGRVPENKELLHWKKHLVLPTFLVETTIFEDITGDGVPELICGLNDRLGYARPDASDPGKPWTFVAISPVVDVKNWRGGAHALGAGDVDGDGRKDILRLDGWWRQPATLDKAVLWEFHPFNFTPGSGVGGADMFAYDLNGDGLNDVITSINAHGWGLSWFEQVRSGSGEISFNEHVILGKTEKTPDNPYGVQFSELHALALVDVDGDGLKDILTGQTYAAHDFHDPGSRLPPVIYWFRLTRIKKMVEYIPHLIDDRMGIGRRIDVGDMNKDGLVDFVIGNKNGAAIFLQKTRAVNAKEWKAAQPVRIPDRH